MMTPGSRTGAGVRRCGTAHDRGGAGVPDPPRHVARVTPTTPRDAERDMDSPTHSPAVQTALDQPAERRRMLDLSLTQIVGGSAAAATGAALASTLGVAGTVLGAAAVSVTTAVASAAYTQSLRRTGDRVRSTGARQHRPQGRWASPTTKDRQIPPARQRPSIAPPGRRPVRVRPVAVAAAAIFAVAILAITGVELLTGQAISGTGRTTVSGVAAEVRGGSRPAVPTPRPGPTPSDTPAAPSGSTGSPSTSGTSGAPTAGDPTTTGPTPSGSTTPTTPAPSTTNGPPTPTAPPPTTGR